MANSPFMAHNNGAAAATAQNCLGGASVSGTITRTTYPRIILNGKEFLVTSVSVHLEGGWKSYPCQNLDAHEYAKLAHLIEKVQETFNNTYDVTLSGNESMSLVFNYGEKNNSLSSITESTSTKESFKHISFKTKNLQTEGTNSPQLEDVFTNIFSDVFPTDGFKMKEEDKKSLWQRISLPWRKKEDRDFPQEIGGHPIQDIQSEGDALVIGVLEAIIAQPEVLEKANKRVREIENFVTSVKKYKALPKNTDKDLIAKLEAKISLESKLRAIASNELAEILGQQDVDVESIYTSMKSVIEGLRASPDSQDWQTVIELQEKALKEVKTREEKVEILYLFAEYMKKNGVPVGEYFLETLRQSPLALKINCVRPKEGIWAVGEEVRKEITFLAKDGKTTLYKYLALSSQENANLEDPNQLEPYIRETEV